MAFPTKCLADNSVAYITRYNYISSTWWLWYIDSFQINIIYRALASFHAKMGIPISAIVVTPANHMTMNYSFKNTYHQWADLVIAWLLKTKGNINLKLWELWESLTVYILLSAYQWFQMTLAVNIPDVTRWFFSWIEPPAWITW